MRFRCKLSRLELQERRDLRYKLRVAVWKTWRPWLAWYPVNITRDEPGVPCHWVWLETVMRRWEFVDDCLFGPYWRAEYKEVDDALS